MKTKNRKLKNEPEETFIVGSDSPVAADPVPTEQGNGYKPGSKLQVSLKEDGSIDWESMRGSTREKVEKAIRSSNLKIEDAPQAQMFNSQMVGGMYDMLGSIESVCAQRFGKIPPHIAKQVFTYTPAEKNALEVPTLRVLNKWIPDWMIKYQDEITLVSTLIAITTTKVNAAIMLAKLSQVESVPMPKKEGDEPVVPN